MVHHTDINPYNLELENAIMDQRGKFQVLRTTYEIPDLSGRV